MATVFSVRKEREQLVFAVRAAVISTRELSVENLTGDETFTLQTDATAPFTIGPISGFANFPYGEDDGDAFASDLGTDIDGKLGANKVTVAGPDDNGSIALIRLPNFNVGSISTSDVSTLDFATLPIPNLTKTIGTDTEVQCQSGFSQVEFLGAKPDASLLYEIPQGANEIAIWTKIESNDPDGYAAGVIFGLAWTNGTDGYVDDGYATEYSFHTSTNSSDLTVDLADSTATALRLALQNSIVTTGALTATGLFGEKNALIKAKVPAGATGCYIVSAIQFHNTTTPTSASPPTFSVAITAETR